MEQPLPYPDVPLQSDFVTAPDLHPSPPWALPVARVAGLGCRALRKLARHARHVLHFRHGNPSPAGPVLSRLS